MAALTATGINLPQINTMDEFSKGVGASQASQINQQNLDTAKQQQYMQGLNTIAAGAAYATDPTTGQVDPTKWNEVVDAVGKSGADVAQFKNHPQMAPMLIKLSLTTQNQIANAQTQQQIDMAIQKFGIEVAQFTHPLPVKMSPGDYMADPRTGVPTDGSAPQSGFYGNSTEQQALQIVAKGDPATFEYAQAYNILSQPTITTMPDGHGGTVQVQTPRTLPQGIRQPTYTGDASPAPLTPTPPGGPAASGAGNPFAVAPNQVGQPNAPIGSNGTTVTPLPGVVPPKNEPQGRLSILGTSLGVSAPAVLDNFLALADPVAQGLSVGGDYTYFMQSDGYKQAITALNAGIADIVPAISGAAFSSKETQDKVKSFTPVFGDGPNELALKARLFVSYVTGIANQSGDDAIKEQASQLQGKLDTLLTTIKAGGKGTASDTKGVVDWTVYFKDSLPTH